MEKRKIKISILTIVMLLSVFVCALCLVSNHSSALAAGEGKNKAVESGNLGNATVGDILRFEITYNGYVDTIDGITAAHTVNMEGIDSSVDPDLTFTSTSTTDIMAWIDDKRLKDGAYTDCEIGIKFATGNKIEKARMYVNDAFVFAHGKYTFKNPKVADDARYDSLPKISPFGFKANKGYNGNVLQIKNGATVTIASPFIFEGYQSLSASIITIAEGGVFTVNCDKEGFHGNMSYDYLGGVFGGDMNYPTIDNEGTINYNNTEANAFKFGDSYSTSIKNSGTLNITGQIVLPDASKFTTFADSIQVEANSVINLNNLLAPSYFALFNLNFNQTPDTLIGKTVLNCDAVSADSLKANSKAVNLSFKEGANSNYVLQVEDVTCKIIYNKKYNNTFKITGNNNSYTLRRHYTKIVGGDGTTYFEKVLTNANITEILADIKDKKTEIPTIYFGENIYSLYNDSFFSYSVTNGTIVIDFDCILKGDPFLLGTDGSSPVIQFDKGITVTSYANFYFGVGEGMTDSITADSRDSCGYMQNDGTLIIRQGTYKTGTLSDTNSSAGAFTLYDSQLLLIKNSGTIQIDFLETENKYLKIFGYVERSTADAIVEIKNQGDYSSSSKGITQNDPIKVLVPYGTPIKDITPFAIGEGIKRFPSGKSFNTYNKIYVANDTAKVYFSSAYEPKATTESDGNITVGKTIHYTTKNNVGGSIIGVPTAPEEFALGTTKTLSIKDIVYNDGVAYVYAGMYINGTEYSVGKIIGTDVTTTEDFVITFFYNKATFDNKFKVKKATEGSIEFYAHITYRDIAFAFRDDYFLVCSESSFANAFEVLPIVKDTTKPIQLIFDGYADPIDLDLSYSQNKKVALSGSIKGAVTIHYPLYCFRMLDEKVTITLGDDFNGDILVYNATNFISTDMYIFTLSGGVGTATDSKGNIIKGIWKEDYTSYQISNTSGSGTFDYAVKEKFDADGLINRYKVLGNVADVNAALKAIKDLNNANNGGGVHTIYLGEGTNGITAPDKAVVEFHNNAILQGKISTDNSIFRIAENATVVFDSLELGENVNVSTGATLKLQGATLFGADGLNTLYIVGAGAKVEDVSLSFSKKVIVAVDYDLAVGDMFIKTDYEDNFRIAEIQSGKLNALKTGVYNNSGTKGYYIGLKVPFLLQSSEGITSGNVVFGDTWSITAKPMISGVTNLPNFTYRWEYSVGGGNRKQLINTGATISNAIDLTVGKYHAFYCKAEFALDGKTSTSTEMKVSFTVTKKTITVGTPTYSETTLTFGDRLTDASLVNSGFTQYGNYQFVVGQTLNAGTHTYNWIFVPKSDLLTNYEFQNVTGTITLTAAKKNVSVVWETLDDFTYNGLDQRKNVFAYYIDISNNKSYFWLTCEREFKDVDVDGHPFRAVFEDTVQDNNYNITANITAVYHIKPKPITLKANDLVLEYGSSIPTYSINFGGDVVAEKDIKYTQANFSCSYTSTSMIGKYTISISNISNDNYTITLDNTATVTVNQIKATVNVENATKVYGKENPSFKINTTGFRESDNIVFTATTTADKTSVVGEYSITITKQDLEVYDITYTNGTLTVTKATYVDIIYGEQLFGVYDPNNTLADYTLKEDYRWADNTIVPTANITQYTAIYNKDSVNYEDCIVTIEIIITRASVSVPTIENKTFNGEKQNSGLVSTLEYSVADEGGIVVGDYNAVLSLGENYIWADGTKEVKILVYTILPTESFINFMKDFENTIALEPSNLLYTQVGNIAEMVKKYDCLSEIDKKQLSIEQKRNYDDLKSKAEAINAAKTAAESAIKALEGATVETIREEGIANLTAKHIAADQTINTYKKLSNGFSAEDLCGYTEYYLPIPILLKNYNDNLRFANQFLASIKDFKAEDLVTRPNDDDRRIIGGKLSDAINHVRYFIEAGGKTDDTKLIGYEHIERVTKELEAFDAYLAFYDIHEHKWEMNTDNMTLGFVALLKELEVAYNILLKNDRAIELLTSEEIAKIDSAIKKGNDILAAKAAAEEANKALIGATADTIRAKGYESLLNKVKFAIAATNVYTSFALGNLTSNDLESNWEIELANTLLKKYDDTLDAANVALAKLVGKTAQGMTTSTRPVIGKDLRAAIAKVEAFVTAGGKDTYLAEFAQIARVEAELAAFDEHKKFNIDYSSVWLLDINKISIADIPSIEELETAYKEFSKNVIAVALLKPLDVVKIEAIILKANDIKSAKTIAETALKELEGTTVETIRESGIEELFKKHTTALNAISEFKKLSSGLRDSDLIGIEYFNTADELYENCITTLAAANIALQELADKTAQNIIDGVFTRDALAELLVVATTAVTNFINTGGRDTDLEQFAQIARVKTELVNYDAYHIFFTAYETTWQILPQDLTLTDGVKVAQMQEAYEALSVEIKLLLTADEITDIEAVIEKSSQILEQKFSADEALAKLDGITAEGLHHGTFDLSETETAIATAIAAAKSYTDLSSGVTTSDLEGYGNITAAEKAVVDYKAYKAFADNYGDIYATDSTKLTYSEALKVNEMYNSYLLMTEDAKSILTNEEAANIATLKGKADSLIEKKESADIALESLNGALSDSADKETLQDLIADALNKTESYFSENGTAEDLAKYDAIQVSKDRVSEYEKEEFNEQVKEDIGAIENFTPEAIGGMDITSLEDVIEKVQDAIEKIDASSDKTKDELKDKRLELEELKVDLTQKLNLENNKVVAINELKEAREKLLASSAYSSSAKKEIAKFYSAAIEDITRAETVEMIAERQEGCVIEMRSVEELHVGWLVTDIILALLLLAEIAFLVWRKFSKNKVKKSVKTYSVLPYGFLAAVSGAGLTTGIVFFVLLLTAVLALGVWIVDRVLRDRTGKSLFSPITDKVDVLLSKMFHKNTSQVQSRQESLVETFEKEQFSDVHDTTDQNKPSMPMEYEKYDTFSKVIKLANKKILIRYNYSFQAKLIQSPFDVQTRFGALTAELNAYSELKSALSWRHVRYHIGRNVVARLLFRGKTLCVALPVDPKKYADTKLRCKDMSSVKRFQDAPMLIKLTSDRKVRYAAELLREMLSNYGIGQTEVLNSKFFLPYESTEELIGKGLVKILSSEEITDNSQTVQANVSQLIREKITLREAQSVLTDEVAAALVVTRGAKNSSLNSSQDVPRGKRGIVNIDTLSESFTSGDTITLASLKEKKLIMQSVLAVKILARGTLNKALVVEAQDFSLDAVKMILLTGGKAIKTL